MHVQPERGRMDQEQEDGQAQENGQPDHPTVGHQHAPGHIASPHDSPLSQIVAEARAENRKL